MHITSVAQAIALHPSTNAQLASQAAEEREINSSPSELLPLDVTWYGISLWLV